MDGPTYPSPFDEILDNLSQPKPESSTDVFEPCGNWEPVVVDGDLLVPTATEQDGAPVITYAKYDDLFGSSFGSTE